MTKKLVGFVGTALSFFVQLICAYALLNFSAFFLLMSTRALLGLLLLGIFLTPGFALVSTYVITQTGMQNIYPAHTLVDTVGTQEEINLRVETTISQHSLAPVGVRTATSVLGDEGYASVRMDAVGAGSNVQIWAEDSLGNWYDVNIVGWGPMEGFPLPASYDEATPVYLISDQRGVYPITVSLRDLVADEIITSSTANFATQYVATTTVSDVPVIIFDFFGGIVAYFASEAGSIGSLLLLGSIMVLLGGAVASGKKLLK